MYPSDRRYAKEHEWILVEGESGTVGITQYAQEQLGDIVYVELPEEGREVGKDEVIGTIESVKAVSEIYSPISGTISAVNQDLEGKPETVNQDPHGAGWYCKMTIKDPSEIEAMLDADGYAKFVESL